MIGFVVGLVIGALGGFVLCALLTANTPDEDSTKQRSNNND